MDPSEPLIFENQQPGDQKTADDEEKAYPEFPVEQPPECRFKCRGETGQARAMGTKDQNNADGPPAVKRRKFGWVGMDRLGRLVGGSRFGGGATGRSSAANRPLKVSILTGMRLWRSVRKLHGVTTDIHTYSQQCPIWVKRRRCRYVDSQEITRKCWIRLGCFRFT